MRFRGTAHLSILYCRRHVATFRAILYDAHGEINNSARASVSASERIFAQSADRSRAIALIRETFSLPLAGSSRLEVDSLSCRGYRANWITRRSGADRDLSDSPRRANAFDIGAYLRLGGLHEAIRARPDDINIDNRASVHLPVRLRMRTRM